MTIAVLSSLMTTPSEKLSPPPVSYRLKGDVVLPIHTKKAQALCQGSWKSYEDMGLFQFASVMAIADQAAVQDDPYAEWHKERMEDELKTISLAIKAAITQHDQVLQQCRGRLEVEIFGSQQPMKLLLEFSAPLGYLAAYTIGDLDYLLRQIYTFRRLGGIFPESQKTGFQLFWQLKAIFAKSRRWRHTGVTRQDIREKNQKGQRAKALMGFLPSRILKRKKKNPFRKDVPLIYSAGQI